jgi:2-polyprenyl-3-methyl-5-hydroxy-6-metoxy-1,4-benzoquinol methylase
MPDATEITSYYQSRVGMIGTGYIQQYQKKKLKIFRSILMTHNLLDKTSILEIGPGPVGISSIVPIGATYIAVEPGIAYSKALKESAKSRNLHFHAYQSIDMVPKNMRFDLFFTSAAFEHLIDPRTTFNTAMDLLNPGAMVVFGVPDRSVEIPDYPFIQSGLYKKVNYGENHLHSFSLASVRALFEQGGVGLLHTNHMLKHSLVTAHHKLSNVIKVGVSNQRMMSARWIIQYLKALFIIRIATYTTDRRQIGDDRCEAIYIGIKE